MRKDWLMGMIVGIALLIADVWAILKTLQSPVTPGIKAAWVFVIFFLPFLGLVIWFLFGPRSLQV
jgi:hypothetical protein